MQKKGRIIVIGGSKGGIGKTTTSYNIMHELNPDHVLDQDTAHGLRVIANMRDEPLALPLEHYSDVKSMLKALEEYRSNGKTVLVDCGGFDSDVTRAAVAVADLVIVPSSDSVTDRAGLYTFDQIIADINRNVSHRVKAYLLLCKVHPSQRHFTALDADLQHAKHILRMRSVIATRPDHHRSQELGLGVTERLQTRHTEAGKEVRALCDEIRELLKKPAY